MKVLKGFQKFGYFFKNFLAAIYFCLNTKEMLKYKFHIKLLMKTILHILSNKKKFKGLARNLRGHMTIITTLPPASL